MSNLEKLPLRFAGPYEVDFADTLTDRILADDLMKELLMQFCVGGIDPREFVYEFQALLECEEDRMNNFTPDGMFQRKCEREEALCD